MIAVVCKVRDIESWLNVGGGGGGGFACVTQNVGSLLVVDCGVRR